MPAVVLQGPANTAPDRIIGPFATMDAAEEWARAHPREDGYCVPQELTSTNEAEASDLPRGELGSSPFVGFIPVTDVGASRTFYESTLGLKVLDESPFALVVDANGITLRITPVPDLKPQPFTIAGWEVHDLAATIDALTRLGARFSFYEGFEQEANGVWIAPSGNLVAWFVDPDGNTLSLTQFAFGRGPTERGRERPA